MKRDLKGFFVAWQQMKWWQFTFINFDIYLSENIEKVKYIMCNQIVSLDETDFYYIGSLTDGQWEYGKVISMSLHISYVVLHTLGKKEMIQPNVIQIQFGYQISNLLEYWFDCSEIGTII